VLCEDCAGAKEEKRGQVRFSKEEKRGQVRFSIGEEKVPGTLSSMKRYESFWYFL
jgi:hypothetical protein